METVKYVNVTKIFLWNESDAVYSAEPYPDFSQIVAVRLTFVVAYVIVMVLSLVGNAVICCTVFNNRKMHTAVNYYIVSLAFCDFMVGGFVLPMKLLELTSPASWELLNNGVCTSMMYLQTIFVFASVLTLVAICIERYMAVVHPLESRMQQTKRRAKRILLVVWLIPCLIAAPYLKPWDAVSNTLSSEYGTISRISCFSNLDEFDRRCFYTFLFIFMYVVPLVFIGVTCGKVARVLLKDIPVQRQGSIRRQEANRRKIAKMVLVVVLAFAICWTPYFLVTIVTVYQEVNFFERENYFFTMLCINLFAFMNSCVNPLIYASMSARFRHGFRSFFRIVFCCDIGTLEVTDPAFQPRSDASLFKAAHRQKKCRLPNLCVVPQTSSESGSGCPNDSMQHTAITIQSHRSFKTFSLRSGNKRFKCKMIVRYMNRKNKLEMSGAHTRISKAQLSVDSGKSLLMNEPPLSNQPLSVLGVKTTFHGDRKCVSENDVTLLSLSSEATEESVRSEKSYKADLIKKYLSCVDFTYR